MNIFCLAVVMGVGTAAAPAPVVDAQGTKLSITTPTVRAMFDGPVLQSVRPADADVEFVQSGAKVPGIDLLYMNGELLGTDKHQKVQIVPVSDTAARIEVTGADSTRSLLVIADADTGDVRITADGLSARRGLRAVRWTLPAHADDTVILPCVNGLRFRVNQPHPPTRRFGWPFEWNAQLAILQRGDRSLMVHCEDQAYRFKALQLDRHPDRTDLSFEAESPGPLWDNRTAGGIEWRINTYKGDWHAPATRYKHWMEQAYRLKDLEQHRPAWVKNITLAVCWAGPSVPMLEALAAVHPPAQTLIHLSEWRTDKYDVNYPEYNPTDEALKYMARARELGFHVMPHFNYFAIYLKHPFFDVVRDFQLRTVDRNIPDGWYWPPPTHDYTRMAYVHPGLGVLRNKMMDVVGQACDKVGTDTAFLDQTLCTWNTDNGTVQGMNTILGMWEMEKMMLAARPAFVIAGEGLNEISFQRQCFAQAHIFEGWGKLEQKHVDVQHSINSFLWGDHTRFLGYYKLTPGAEGFDKGVAIYERMGAIPTIVTGDPKQLREPSELTRHILDLANGKVAASRAE